MDRTNDEINFHMTEFLSGHGGFGEYLFRIGRADSPLCPECIGKIESPEHVLFELGFEPGVVHCTRLALENLVWLTVKKAN